MRPIQHGHRTAAADMAVSKRIIDWRRHCCGTGQRHIASLDGRRQHRACEPKFQCHYAAASAAPLIDGDDKGSRHTIMFEHLQINVNMY